MYFKLFFLKRMSVNTIFLSIKKYIRLLFDIHSAFHKNFITFLFFVVISAILWFFRALSNEYETEISYPVRYINIPDNKILVNKMPEKLTLKVKAKGKKILPGKLNLNILPLKFDVNSFLLNNSQADSFLILTNTVKDILSKELEGMEILSISPDTLVFRFTNIAIKKVVVKLRFQDDKQAFAPQHMLNGDILINPDSIIISGPLTLINNISCVYTEPLNISGIADTTRKVCNIARINGISYSQKKVNVTIPVDTYTQAEFELPVAAINLPDSLNIKTFPQRVRITYNITLSQYEKIKPEQIQPCINYLDLQQSPPPKLARVFLVDTPHIINSLKFSPEKVEYLLSRK